MCGPTALDYSLGPAAYAHSRVFYGDAHLCPLLHSLSSWNITDVMRGAGDRDWA